MDKTKRLALIWVFVAILMFGFSYASVPLYRIFCQVTGFGGTPKKIDQNNPVPDLKIGNRNITISFNTTLQKQLPWTFYNEIRNLTIKPGEIKHAFFYVKNNSSSITSGTASFNITPEKAAPYLTKIACFCFDELILKPGEETKQLVTFYVDPRIEKEEQLKDVTDITLSYTFFKTKD
jgi:cytochrome c oxidase assembly protein subunit 11